MTSQRNLAVLAAAAAMLAAGCATSGSTSGPAKAGARPGSAKTPGASAPGASAPGATAPGAKAGDPKSAAAAPEGAKPADAAPAGAMPAESKPVAAAAPVGDAKVAPPAPPASGGADRGFWASYDEFMKKKHNQLQETRFLGLQIHPRLTEEISFTDNVYYQDRNEKLVVDRTVGPSPLLAHPNLGQPRGMVSDIVNTATLGVDFELPLNLALVPIVGTGTETVKAFSAEITSVEYLVHADSPDALNYAFHLDLPALINQMIGRLKSIDASNHAFYVRLEGDYAVTSDPLDVAKLGFSSTAPTFHNDGERNSFQRTEYFVKATVGWKGPVFDSKVSYRHYRMQLEDNSLKPADHNEQESYAEIGYRIKRSEHRVYGFGEYTNYDFDNRGTFDPNNPNEDDTAALRDFAKIRTGMGWEGPLYSKKVRAGAEIYYLATNVFHEGPYWTHPFDTTIGTGGVVTDGAGNIQRQRFTERGMVAGKANLSYRPFVTKGTQFQAEYERDVDFSVVAQDKVVDQGTLTFTHPVNDRVTAELFTGITMENMQHREKRLYSEFGAGARYKLASFTELYLRYSLRHMRSRHEPVTAQVDNSVPPEIYLVKADGDFTANIVSFGVTIDF